MVEVEARFNSGGGGVSIVVSREDGTLMGHFLQPREAVALALEILHKVMDVPAEIDSKLRELVPGGRRVLPVKK